MLGDEYIGIPSEFASNGLARCKSCGKLCNEAFAICDDCRDKFINYPIPRKILIPLLFVSCIVIVLMYLRFPTSLQAGIHYERAIKSMHEHNYIDAENELQQAYNIFPLSSEIIGNLAISAYKNNNIEKLFTLLDIMYTYEISINNEELFKKVSDINDAINEIFNIPEEFIYSFEDINQMQPDDMIAELNKYIEKYPDSTFIKIHLANILFDTEQYDDSETIVQQVFEVCYFRFENPAGYVVHEKPKEAYKNILIGVGPFFVNTILGGLIAAGGSIPVLKFNTGNILDLFLMWLGVSIAMHAFPSVVDARQIWGFQLC